MASMIYKIYFKIVIIIFNYYIKTFKGFPQRSLISGKIVKEDYNYYIENKKIICFLS